MMISNYNNNNNDNDNTKKKEREKTMHIFKITKDVLEIFKI